MTDSGEPPVPIDDCGPGSSPDPGCGAADGAGLPFVAPDGDGLRFSFELDLVSALEAIGRPLRDWAGVDQEEDLAAEEAALGFADFLPEPAGEPGEPDPPGPGTGAAPSGPGTDPAGAGTDAAPSGPGADHCAAVAGTPPGPRGDLGGAVAEVLPAGPGLAAWLSGQDPATATGRDLVGDGVGGPAGCVVGAGPRAGPHRPRRGPVSGR